MNTKHFDCHFEIKDIKQEGDLGIVEGFASTFGNVDKGRDIVQRGAFLDSIESIRSRKGHIPFLKQHNPNSIIGKVRAENMRETDQGLFIKAEINLGTTLGRDTFALLKEGDLDEFSIGFKTVKEEINAEKNVRNLITLELWEISVVTFPMNPDAIVTNVKSIFHDLPILRGENSEPNTQYEWDGVKALANIKTEKNHIGNAFLLENADNDEENKFLIADIVDGELKVIPRAVFTAAGALCGDRGTLGLSDEQKASVQRNIERYYEKLDIESPFKKGLGPNELGRMTIKQIKTYLRDNGFSVAGAEYLSCMASKGIKSLSNSGPKSQSDSGEERAFAEGLTDLTRKLKES